MTVVLQSGGMTPIKAVLGYKWVCRQCKYEWDAKDPSSPPKVCARCKKTNWDRKKKPVGRPKGTKKKGK